MFNRSQLTRLCVIILAVTSVLNAGWLANLYFHTNHFSEGSLTSRTTAMAHLKSTIQSMGVREVDYKADVETDPDLEGDFFQIQHIMAPIILNRYSSSGPLLLMRFRSADEVSPQPGFMFLEGDGYGLALFRKS